MSYLLCVMILHRAAPIPPFFLSPLVVLSPRFLLWGHSSRLAAEPCSSEWTLAIHTHKHTHKGCGLALPSLSPYWLTGFDWQQQEQMAPAAVWANEERETWWELLLLWTSLNEWGSRKYKGGGGWEGELHSEGFLPYRTESMKVKTSWL